MAEKKVIAVTGATGAQGGGLVRAILADSGGGFAVRAITRDTASEKARKLGEAGAEVVAADLDDPASVQKAFRGAHGVYCVTFYWAHFSAEKELVQARTMAEAAGRAGVQHAIWSTLEDTRRFFPLSDDRVPTLEGKYKVPHFDAKGEADRFFTDAGVPTTFLLPSFYWENMIAFGQGPKAGPDGKLVLALPMGDKKLAGIAAEDIGKCAYGVFKGGKTYVGRRIGVAGDHQTGAEMAAAFTEVLGREVRYEAISPETYRGFGFPGAEEMGNMYQFYRDYERECLAMRDLKVSRALNPQLQTFREWLERNRERIPLG